MQVNAVSGAAAGSISAAWQKTLDKNDFLRLLAAQLQYQNPLEPVQDTEFITQLAQFTVLAQVNEMIEQQRYAAFIQAQGLIGKQVVADGTGEQPITGTVEAVRLSGDDIIVVLGDKEVSWTNLREIKGGT